MTNPHQVTRDFEQALCAYTGAHFAVSTNSCTMALLIAMAYHHQHAGNIAVACPQFTYVGVPQAIIHAGFWPEFKDKPWLGEYRLSPLLVWDSARHFTSGMYRSGAMQCVSFHTSKILGDTQGGAILHDNSQADKWLRKARFDGRTEGVLPTEDKFIIRGWHCYMSPDVAARLLWKLSNLPMDNEPLPNSDYPDLSQLECFK